MEDADQSRRLPILPEIKLQTGSTASAIACREADLCRREKELDKREADLSKRELELEGLRVSEACGGDRLSQTSDAKNQGKVNLSDLKELIKPFDGCVGSYSTWERQVRFVKETYKLTDSETRVLIVTRMRKKIVKWFHSDPEHLEMPLEDLFKKLKDVFGDRSKISGNMESRKPQRGTVRCYGCWGLGHLAKDCPQPKRDKTACFQCGKADHKIKNCPNKPAITTTAQFTYFNDQEKPQDDCLHRKLEYELEHEGEKFRFRLDTLFDSGTAVSFIKEKYLMKDAIVRINHRPEYYGTSNSELKILGIVRLRIFLVNSTSEDDELRLLVVDNDTIMNSAVVLGRDCWKLKFHALNQFSGDMGMGSGDS